MPGVWGTDGEPDMPDAAGAGGLEQDLCRARVQPPMVAVAPGAVVGGGALALYRAPERRSEIDHGPKILNFAGGGLF
jgi:hypothetical protein